MLQVEAAPEESKTKPKKKKKNPWNAANILLVLPKLSGNTELLLALFQTRYFSFV